MLIIPLPSIPFVLLSLIQSPVKSPTPFFPFPHYNTSDLLFPSLDPLPSPTPWSLNLTCQSTRITMHFDIIGRTAESQSLLGRQNADYLLLLHVLMCAFPEIMDQSEPGNEEVWGSASYHLHLSLAQEVAISVQTPFNQASSCQVQTLVSAYSKEGMSIWCLLVVREKETAISTQWNDWKDYLLWGLLSAPVTFPVPDEAAKVPSIGKKTP